MTEGIRPRRSDALFVAVQGGRGDAEALCIELQAVGLLLNFNTRFLKDGMKRFILSENL